MVKGEATILLVAHLDTVHREKVKVICYSDDGNILMSPQGIGGDDRCGVYALTELYKLAECKPWLLFTCEEETGGVGAADFVKWLLAKKLPEGLADIKLIVELDRRGNKDAVYYECDNQDFERYISSRGFETELGSFSDISVIAPAMGVAAVNLSAGYYHAHTQHEYINRGHLNQVMGKVEEIIRESAMEDFPRYEYVGQVYGYNVPLNIPKKYVGLYEELLDCYFPNEIEDYRAHYGNSALKMLYEYAFGIPYTGPAEMIGEGSGADEDSRPDGEISQTAHADGRNERLGYTGKQGEFSARSESEVDTVVSAMPIQ